MRFLTLMIAVGLLGLGSWAAEPPAAAAPAQTPAEEANADFTYQGKPIHPGCIWEFEVWMSEGAYDPPRVLTVDVDSCTTSQKNFKPTRTDERSYVTGYSHLDDSHAYFSYKHLGRTSSGTHVLRTMSGGEGTLVKIEVCLVRVETEEYFTYRDRAKRPTPERRLVLKCVGQIGLGDRDNGTVELRDDTLVLGKSRYREREEQFQLP